MNLAFAGLRHSHIFGLYDAAMKRSDVTVVGAWEEDDQARAAARARIDAPFYDSFDALLGDESVDAVAVGDYYGIRHDRIVRALKAGKDVICDKPLCVSQRELDEIESLSLEKRLRVECMLDLRYDPAVNLARGLVRAGRLGTIHAVNFTGQHPLSYGVRPMWYFEAGKHGGTINDIAIHGLDAIRYITGAELVRTVAAREWNAFAAKAPDFKDCAQFMAEFDGGMGVTADVSYAAQTGTAFSMPSYWRFTFWGDEGALEFQVGKGDATFAAKGADALETLEAAPVHGGWLDDFLRPFDADAQMNTFASQRTALRIEEAARG